MRGVKYRLDESNSERVIVGMYQLQKGTRRRSEGKLALISA